ncbi:MAG: Calx-beta domain-containing protein, partial [Eubacteriales bacterium]|nr:Calx-beta domain-containing protein [Eubacteriales bacterium]
MKLKFKRVFRSLTSAVIIASMTLLQPMSALANAVPEVVEVDGTRITEDLPDENLVYFGNANISVMEAPGEFIVPIYREGDLSEAASVTIRSLDVSALYGKDYELLGGNRTEYDSEKTIMQLQAEASLSKNLDEAKAAAAISQYEFEAATETNMSSDAAADAEANAEAADADAASQYLLASVNKLTGEEAEAAKEASSAAVIDAIMAAEEEAEAEKNVRHATETDLEEDAAASDDEGSPEDEGEPESDLTADELLVDQVKEQVEITGKSSLAILKEMQTGEPTRDSVSSEFNGNITQQLLDNIMPDAMLEVPYSCEQVIEFAPGQDEAKVRFRIYNDNKAEGSEVFTLIMSDSENVYPYSVTSMAVMIMDDEAAVHSVISFAEPETDGTSKNDIKAILAIIRDARKGEVADAVVEKETAEKETVE